jgi:cytochrome P450
VRGSTKNRENPPRHLTGALQTDPIGLADEASRRPTVTAVDLTGTFADDLDDVLRAAAQEGPLTTDVATGATVVLTDGPLRAWYGGLMFTNEGDYHRRIRSLVARAFTPRSVAAYSTVATRLMCRLLGVPDTDVPVFAAWLDALSPVFLVMTPEQIADATTAITELQDYVDELTTRRSHSETVAIIFQSACGGT